MSHYWAAAKWLGFLMAYPIIMHFTFNTPVARRSAMFTFMNTIATGFNLSFENFYFVVVFPILAVFLAWWWIVRSLPD